ncbi:MAG TPA: DUF763 domain-containing protein [Methanocellales archaeon]|nr:DUF763 domain-containing protein [Methanocellales archaeon]
MKRTGIVNLPLHGGKAPRWLFDRMVKLAGGITEILIYEYGQEEFLRRVSEPYWFQAFSCVLGFDWHSSGTTTTVCGALKVAIDPEEYGLKVAGGKGRTSRRTLAEIEETADLFALSTSEIEKLKYSSKMSAKVDNNCVQDGYQLYHHCFIFTERGKWVVIQQGMNEQYARRYHWLSDSVESFVEEPHVGICSDRREESVLDLTSRDSKNTRDVSLDLIRDGPENLMKYLRPAKQKQLKEFAELSMPAHHPILAMDLSKREREVLKKAYEIQPDNYEELVYLKGMGPKKIRALALISDIIYGTNPSWKDPVKYSFAHGGKDGFPYPVNREVYDTSIKTLEDAIEGAKLDDKDRYHAIKRLRDFCLV